MGRLNGSSFSMIITGSQNIFEQFEASGKRNLAAGAADNFKVFQDNQEDVENIVVSALSAGKSKKADILIVERLSEIRDKEILISKAVAAKTACEKAGNVVPHIYGYFLLPDNFDDEREDAVYSDTYAALQRIEYNRMFEEQAYHDVILISGDNQEIQEWLVDAVIHFTGNEVHCFSQQSLYSDWRRAKEEYLSSAGILSGGLIKSTVLPEDSHSYCSMGFSYAELAGGGLDSGTLGNVNQQLFSKVNGRGWVKPGIDEVQDSFLEEQMRKVLGLESEESINGFWEKYLLKPLRECAMAESNPVELTRAQINARNTKAYVQGFHIEEKVKAGIDAMTKKIRRIPRYIMRNAKPALEEYGPWLMLYLFYGNAGRWEVSIRNLLSLGFQQLGRAAEEKMKRPVRQIVGSLSEEALRVRIEEWKNQFQLAVESEIRAKIAMHFISEEGEWENLMEKPLKDFAEACEALIEELDKGAAVQKSNLGNQDLGQKSNSGKRYVVNLEDCGSVSEWLKEQAPDHIQPAQLSVLKENLIHHLIQRVQEGKKPGREVSEMAANAVMDKKVTLADYFSYFADTHTENEMQEMIREFVDSCLLRLLAQSTPVLKTGFKEGYRRHWVIFPERMLESGYGKTLKEETEAYLDKVGSGEYTIVGAKGENIVCYQSELGLPLYELGGLWKWEQSYNKKMETETLDWKHYFPLALRHLNRNTVNKKFYEEFFSPCVDYALREKIIERKFFPGEEKKYLYVMNLLPDSWTNLSVSNYRVGDAEGRAKKGEALFQYLRSMNTFSEDSWQRDIILPDSGVFSKAFDFSDVAEGMDIDSISISYMKRILQKNIPLFVLLRRTVKKYMRMQRNIDALRIAPVQTEEDISGNSDMKKLTGAEQKEGLSETRQRFINTLEQVGTEQEKKKSVVPEKPEIKKMKYCKFCGAELKKGTERFCSKCGKKLR